MPPEGWIYTGWGGFILQSLGCVVVILLVVIAASLLVWGMQKWSNRPARKARLRRKADKLYKKSEQM